MTSEEVKSLYFCLPFLSFRMERVPTFLQEKRTKSRGINRGLSLTTDNFYCNSLTHILSINSTEVDSLTVLEIRSLKCVLQTTVEQVPSSWISKGDCMHSVSWAVVSSPLFLYPAPTCLFVFRSLIPYCQPSQSPLLWAFSVTQGNPPISELVIASHVGTCGSHWHVGDISSSHGSLWEHCLAAMLISKVLVTLVLQTMAVMAPEDGCKCYQGPRRHCELDW